MPIKNVFIYPIIRTDFIVKSIEALKKRTKREDYKIIVVDQSLEGLPESLKTALYDEGDLYLRMRNVGFAKAANEGIIHALRWNSEYITICNDDTVVMYDGWFDDAIEEFKSDPHIVAVCPESPRVAMWGYGLNNGEHVELVPFQEEFSKETIEYLKKGDYDEVEIRARHEFEIPKSFPFTKRGVVDGIAMWMPIFKREAFIELGLFEEKFIWGGGEDYEMLCRAYSCAWPIERDECDPSHHRRMVSTMKSWVWHWWGQSKDVKQTLDPMLFAHKQPWNNSDEIFPPHINGGKHNDPWGHWTDENGVRRPFKRIPEVGIGEI